MNSWLLLLRHFSRVRLCVTPQTTAHQAPPSLGFSRQEHWSGLPFPSLMHESGKWKWSRSVVSDSSRPHGLQPTRLLHPWDFPGKSTGVGCHCLLQQLTVHGKFKFGFFKLLEFLKKYFQSTIGWIPRWLNLHWDGGLAIVLHKWTTLSYKIHYKYIVT